MPGNTTVQISPGSALLDGISPYFSMSVSSHLKPGSPGWLMLSSWCGSDWPRNAVYGALEACHHRNLPALQAACWPAGTGAGLRSFRDSSGGFRAPSKGGYWAERLPRSIGSSPHFSPRGETKCVRGPSVRGARRSARGGVLEQYGEHGEQAQRSNGGLIACFGRQVVRNAG